MFSRVKRQNRVLTAVLTILIAGLIALIALTSGANRKAKPDTGKEPPLSSKYTEKKDEAAPSDDLTPSEAESTGLFGADRSGDKSGDERSEGDEKQPPETETLEEHLPGTRGGEAGEDEEVLAASAAVGIPVFRAPLENAVVVKGCSLTVPVFSATMNDYRVHGGLDFACAPGTPVLAAADGVVISNYKDPMMGQTVALEHDGGAVTRYKGLAAESADLVKVGDRVLRGQVIGASGETALVESAEENHLHFELAVDGVNVDPAEYMDVVLLSDLYED